MRFSLLSVLVMCIFALFASARPLQSSDDVNTLSNTGTSNLESRDWKSSLKGATSSLKRKKGNSGEEGENKKPSKMSSMFSSVKKAGSKLGKKKAANSDAAGDKPAKSSRLSGLGSKAKNLGSKLKRKRKSKGTEDGAGDKPAKSSRLSGFGSKAKNLGSKLKRKSKSKSTEDAAGDKSKKSSKSGGFRNKVKNAGSKLKRKKKSTNDEGNSKMRNMDDEGSSVKPDVKGKGINREESEDLENDVSANQESSANRKSSRKSKFTGLFENDNKYRGLDKYPEEYSEDYADDFDNDIEDKPQFGGRLARNNKNQELLGNIKGMFSRKKSGNGRGDKSMNEDDGYLEDDLYNRKSKFGSSKARANGDYDEKDGDEMEGRGLFASSHGSESDIDKLYFDGEDNIENSRFFEVFGSDYSDEEEDFNFSDDLDDSDEYDYADYEEDLLPSTYDSDNENIHLGTVKSGRINYVKSDEDFGKEHFGTIEYDTLDPQFNTGYKNDRANRNPYSSVDSGYDDQDDLIDLYLDPPTRGKSNSQFNRQPISYPKDNSNYGYKSEDKGGMSLIDLQDQDDIERMRRYTPLKLWNDEENQYISGNKNSLKRQNAMRRPPQERPNTFSQTSNPAFKIPRVPVGGRRPVY